MDTTNANRTSGRIDCIIASSAHRTWTPSELARRAECTYQEACAALTSLLETGWIASQGNGARTRYGAKR